MDTYNNCVMHQQCHIKTVVSSLLIPISLPGKKGQHDIAHQSRNPLWEFDICGDYVVGVLDWISDRLRNIDGSQSNLTKTGSSSGPGDIYCLDFETG